MTINVIGREFSFTRDFRSIDWGATLWYGLLRSALAGVVLMVLILFASGGDPRSLLYPIVTPLIYLVFVLPWSLIGIPILRLFGDIGALVAGITAFCFAAFYALGDPPGRLRHYRLSASWHSP